ncbi:transglutaminase family protein, partial [Wenyingzhuangia sp. 1_MG-2023]|nr:transglutaminase family protein [Wenyingzhuangia sp. 1_MG-2023]
WTRPELLARVDKDYGHTEKDAGRFATLLSEKLGLSDEYVQAAYEDGLHYLLEEQNLPVNLDSEIAEAKDELARRRLARVLDQGLNTPTGFVVPVEWDFYGQSWRSSVWELRRGRITLIPGDSPMGLR